MERLNEVHQLDDEENPQKIYATEIPFSKSIIINNLSFSYQGGAAEPVLKDIHLKIPHGKITAIVGSSGSGKTTLLKLLLKFYENYNGSIRIGDINLKKISHSTWRSNCGSVLQEGFIFNDTIAGNIEVEFDKKNEKRLIAACKVANILSFIESLPDGFNTRLGAEGIGISQGQKQRLLIARAVYKNPPFLFLDESTNALDSDNERIIVENLREFFENKTVIVVAHRLSTVKNADKIIVLHKGEIVEEGDHRDLIVTKGRYYELVKNQLELEY
jgi:ATP-binding cassette subfamily B protein